MRASYKKLYIHLIWGTWKRNNLINEKLEPLLYRLIADKLIEHRCQLIKIGGTEDHIHLLIAMHPSERVSRLAKSIKGYTSYAISKLVYPESFFKWQGGYGAITVSPRDIPSLSKYIVRQKIHHSDNSLIQYWEFDGM